MDEQMFSAAEVQAVLTAVILYERARTDRLLASLASAIASAQREAARLPERTAPPVAVGGR